MTHSDQTEPERLAVLTACSEAGRHAIDESLAKLGGRAAQHFTSTDCDKLNDAVCGGEFNCVLFADMETLLTGIWEGDIHLQTWLQRGIRIEFADTAFGDSCSSQAALGAFYRSVAKWRADQRRRKLIAASILSLAALLCLAVFFLIARLPTP